MPVKKKTVKKAVKKKVAVNAKSKVTGKKPSARLKKRRVANTKKGYYPNPVSSFYAVEINNQHGSGYLTSLKPTFDTEIKKALLFDKHTASIVAAQLEKQLPGNKFDIKKK